MFDVIPLLFGAGMATVDSVVLSGLRAYNLGWLQSKGIVVIAMLFYAFQPLVFLKSLNYSTLTVMNLLWDVTSDVVVTIIGLLLFKEVLSPFKKLGVIFSLISIVLLSIDDKQYTLK